MTDIVPIKLINPQSSSKQHVSSMQNLASYLPNAQKYARYIQDSYNHFSKIPFTQKFLVGSALFIGVSWISSFFTRSQKEQNSPLINSLEGNRSLDQEHANHSCEKTNAVAGKSTKRNSRQGLGSIGKQLRR